jgi:hypothetical protein
VVFVIGAVSIAVSGCLAMIVEIRGCASRDFELGDGIQVPIDRRRGGMSLNRVSIVVLGAVSTLRLDMRRGVVSVRRRGWSG